MVTLQFSPILLLNYIFISFGYQIFFFLSSGNVFGALFVPVIRFFLYSLMALFTVVPKSIFSATISIKIFARSGELSSALRNYLIVRELRPPGFYSEYHPDWNDDDVTDFHTILLLLRDLGIDFRDLTTIDSTSFIRSLRGALKFIRHHLFSNDKKSIDPNRLILAIRRTHHALDHMDPNVLLGFVDQMMNWDDDTCPQYFRTKYPTDWESRWGKVLERREFITSNPYGIGLFLKEYYPDVVRRVFGRDLDARTIEQRISQMFGKFYDFYDLPLPRLPKFIHDRLIGPTQTTIPQFLGNPNP